MVKLTYIVSDVDKALGFEWTASLLAQHYELSFILIGPEQSALAYYLTINKVRHVTLPDTQYSNWFSMFVAVIKTLYRIKPRIVHAHLWRANILGLSAAWLLRINRRIYTRHHAMVHHHEFRKGLWKDKLCNFMATDIVAISQNVVGILQELEHVSSNKIYLVHHGFDRKMFTEVPQDAVDQVRARWGINQSKRPVVGVIARYQKWKGIQYIIPAFKQLLNNYPNAHLILANANGSYSGEVKKFLAQLPQTAFTEITFEQDLAALYKIFDVYVHVPIDPQSEAFGQTYVEALLSGVPSVFSLSGIAREFITDGHNALVVPFQDSDAIHKAIERILSEPHLKNQLIENGRNSVAQFSLDPFLQRLKSLYDKA